MFIVCLCVCFFFSLDRRVKLVALRITQNLWTPEFIIRFVVDRSSSTAEKPAFLDTKRILQVSWEEVRICASCLWYRQKNLSFNRCSFIITTARAIKTHWCLTVWRQRSKNDRRKPTRPDQPFVVISFRDQQTGFATWLWDRERYTDRQFRALFSWNKRPEDSTPREASHRNAILSLIWY